MSLSRDKDKASWLNRTISRAASSPSVHTVVAPRFPQPIPGQKFSSTKRTSTSEFTLIEKRSRAIPFHCRAATSLKSSINRSGTFSRGGRRELSTPTTDFGPLTIMDPEDIQFDETVGIMWSNAPLVTHSDALIQRGTPGPGAYRIIDDRLHTSSSKRPISLSMSKGKKPPTPIDWIIHRSKETPSAHSYDQQKQPKIHGGKIIERVPTYLDHTIRRAKEEPGPFDYNIDCKSHGATGMRFGTTSTLNWAEQAIRNSRFTPSTHTYSDKPSCMKTTLGTPFRRRDDGSGAFDQVIRAATAAPSCCDYSPDPFLNAPTSKHIRGPGQPMTTAKRITDVDLLLKVTSSTPGPRKAPMMNCSGISLLQVQGPPFLKEPRDLNDKLMKRESQTPGPTSYGLTDDDDYMRKKVYGNGFSNNTSKKKFFIDEKIKLQNHTNFLSFHLLDTNEEKKRKRLLKRKEKRNEKNQKEIEQEKHMKKNKKKDTRRSSGGTGRGATAKKQNSSRGGGGRGGSRSGWIRISCRCMGNTVSGIKVNKCWSEEKLLSLLKNKIQTKVKSIISLDSFVLLRPFALLDNTSIELGPSF